MRRFLTASAACLAAAVAFGGAAQAENAKWGKVGPWEIMVDRSNGNGCFMLGSYPGPNPVYLRVGFNNVNNNAYLMIASPAWPSLEPGKVYAISGQFDNETPTTWHATAIKVTENITALQATFNDPYGSMATFGQRLNLRLYYNGNLVTNLKLTGTAAAAAETINCNRQFTAGSGGGSDPFKAQSRPAKRDPFA
jgi:hypothetical protein